VPVVTQRYDAGTSLAEKGLFYLPWVVLLVMTLNYFNVFDRSPAIKSVQDPNVVVVNPDLHKMISDGKVQVAPFIEELRASGKN
jgi:cobalt-zinc-cadmium efflux system membrane fusion protein